MRLFLVSVLCVAWAGCSKGDDLKAGALSVKVLYSGFRPECVKLTVTDRQDVSRTVETPVAVPANQTKGTLSVAVFRQAGWSRDVFLSVSARERNCEGVTVALVERVDATLPEEGITQVDLGLSATDEDGDGYIHPENNGTDCNDKAPEVGGPRVWYPDVDGDGYGDRSVSPSPVCVQPARTVGRGEDCNDADVNVRPNQAEFRCDGEDDNCDGVADEVYALGGACNNAFACPGTNTCDTTDAGVACVSTVTPTAYYADEDGDGKAGADGGVTCGPPPVGTAPVSTDCDESSTFVAQGLPEVCDRLDNNCAGGVDEGITCAPEWQGAAGGTLQSRWDAIAIAQDFAWLAGTTGLDLQGNVLKIQSDGGMTQSTCVGQWLAAWVSTEGQLFLAGKDGKLASKGPLDPGCTIETLPSSSAELTDIVGFDATGGGAPTLYAVSSNGDIFRWVPSTVPVRIAETKVNLQAVHRIPGSDTLLVVGARDIPTPDKEPRAFRVIASTGVVTEERLPSSIGQGYLTGVHAVNQHYAYAVGDNGIALERNHGDWRQLPSVMKSDGGPDNVLDVLAFGQRGVYASTASGTVQFFNGASWTPVYSGDRALRSLDGRSPTALGAAGVEGTYQFFRR